MRIIKFFLLFMLQACSFNLLPNTDFLSFYDLDLIDPSENHKDTLCISGQSQKNQILIREVKTLRPYDGFKIYQKNEGSDLIQFGDVQWIAPLSTLYPSKITELVNIECNRPTFTTDLIAKTDDQLSLTLLVARIVEENGLKVAEAKVNASVRSEKTGEFVLNSSKTVKLKLASGEPHSELIFNLQKAIRNATIEVLTDIKKARY